LKNFHIRNETHRQGLSQACAAGGRTFVLFATILILVMPLTEYYWTFDKFLRGGQDMEFGMLSLAAVLCLILVLSLQRKRRVISLLAARQWLWSASRRRHRPVPTRSQATIVISSDSLPLYPALTGYALPLQI
jgi:hypothetical protein